MNTEKIRENTFNKLNEIGITYSIPLPLIEEEFCFQSKEEIANRANILHIFYAIYLTEKESYKDFRSLVYQYNLNLYITDKERELLATGNISDQDIINFSWCKEFAKTLIWVGSVINEDMMSTLEECDFSLYYSLIPPERSYDDYMENFHIRERSIIIQHLDFYYCLHWCCKNHINQIQSAKLPINPSVVIERRKALEWGTHSDDWDHISLDT